MLPQELLEAKRAYDRLRQRRLRETRRRNRANPAGLSVGVDGLAVLQQHRAAQPAPQPTPAPDPVIDAREDELPAERMMREIRRAQGLI